MSKAQLAPEANSQSNSLPALFELTKQEFSHTVTITLGAQDWLDLARIARQSDAEGDFEQRLSGAISRVLRETDISDFIQARDGKGGAVA